MGSQRNARTLSSTRAPRIVSGARRKLFPKSTGSQLNANKFRRLARAPTAARDGACAPQKGALQLDDLRGVNVLARVNFAEQLFARGGIEIQHRERGAASLISAE